MYSSRNSCLISSSVLYSCKTAFFLVFFISLLPSRAAPFLTLFDQLIFLHGELSLFHGIIHRSYFLFNSCILSSRKQDFPWRLLPAVQPYPHPLGQAPSLRFPEEVPSRPPPESHPAAQRQRGWCVFDNNQ